MRRSRSLSSIPMPISSRRDSKNRPSRDPSLDGRTPLAYKLASVDRKRTVPKTSIRTPTTPSTFRAFKSSGSFGTSRISMPRGKSPNNKSMQKLINDKKWVAAQYSKIQEFISTSGLFNPQFASMIRPPTINTFVELVSVLFSHIFPTVHINSQNYADAVTTNLKLLRYPGSVTVSTIKTANTMHGWPQFISIISWLIDKVNVTSVDYTTNEHYEEELKESSHLHQDTFNFLTVQYGIIGWEDREQDTANDEKLFSESEETLYNNLLKIIKIDPEATHKLEQSLEDYRAEVSDLDSKINEIGNENSQIEGLNLKIMDMINNFEENKGKMEIQIEEEILQLEKQLCKQNKIKEEVVTTVKELENCISIQSCKLEERDTILRQIEDLKKAINRKEQQIEEYRVVKDELDRELKTMVTEIEVKVDRWNVLITKSFLLEMKSLSLREKGFHSVKFLQELKDTKNEKEELEKKFLDEYKTITSDIKRLQKEKASLDNTSKVMDSTRKALDNLNTTVQNLKEGNKNILLEIDDVVKNNEKNIKEIEESLGTQVKQEENEIRLLEERLSKDTENLDKAAKTGVSVLYEAYNMTIEHFAVSDKIMHGMLEDLMAQGDKMSEHLQKTFELLTRIQKETKNLFHNDNEENKENNSIN